MFAYHLRLALLSLKRNPIISALMIGAVAIGVGVCMTTLTIYALMAGNPIPQKSEKLYAVQLDSWDPQQAYNEPDEPPDQLTWRDVQGLLAAAPAVTQAGMFVTGMILEPPTVAGKQTEPQASAVRVTNGTFFRMFDVPFIYGSGWDAATESAGQQVMVLSKDMNQKLFGGADSVGQEVRVKDKVYRVVGVTDAWNVTPKFYDPNNDEFGDGEDAYVPLSLTRPLEYGAGGNTNCWQPNDKSGFDAFLESECVWLQFWAELPDRAAADAYKGKLDAYVMEQKKLGRFGRPLHNEVHDVMDWLAYRKVVGTDNRVLVGLSFMFLVVCMLNTVGLLLAKFLGRAPEIGVRRALGAGRGQIFAMHLVEVGLIGIVGGLLGLGIAWAGLRGVRSLYSNWDRLTSLNLELGLVAVGIALAAGLLAGIYPAWRICRIPPATYLKTQ